MAKEKSNITTVKLERETKSRLDKLRLHRRETYDEILQRVLGILNLSRINPEKAQERLRLIERRGKIIGKKNNLERKDE